MRCPNQMQETIPPASRQDLWLRFLAGHRRIAAEHVSDIAAYCEESFGEPAGWLNRLLSSVPVPLFRFRYQVIDGGGAVRGTKCWRLTERGIQAVDNWLEDGDFYGPLAGRHVSSRR